MKGILLLSVTLLLGFHSKAQYNLKENNIWTFGYHAGMDFNGSTATFFPSAISGNNGSPIFSSAAVSDTNGQLLFYTSGDSIWNRNNQIMPNGYGLMPVPINTFCSQVIDPDDDNSGANVASADASQGALIVPVLNNPNQYYVFSLQRTCSADPAASRLFYSVVDITLNGGLGDVVTGEKGILVDSALAEKMVAIPGDNCDMWVLVHGSQNNIFKAFDITADGVNPVPVASEVGNIAGGDSYVYGDMAVSPNRRKVAIASAGFIGSGGSGSELYDFDPATGMVSNAITLNSGTADYSVCFSPDNSKLYVINYPDSVDSGVFYHNRHICQYDITQTTVSAILNSKIDVSVAENNFNAYSMRLGADGKIYLPGLGVTVDTTVVDAINYPNLSGAACDYVRDVVTLPSPASVYTGLPSMYMKPLRDTIHITTDTSMMLGNGLNLQIPSGYFSYLWNDGSTDSGKTITDTGTYWVTYGNYCTYRTDTFVVHQSTGISHVNGNNIATLTAYPSPAQTTITITIKGISNIKGSLQIIDAAGRTVKAHACHLNKQTMDIGNLADGVYTVEYMDKNQPIHLQQRLVIVK